MCLSVYLSIYHIDIDLPSMSHHIIFPRFLRNHLDLRDVIETKRQHPGSPVFQTKIIRISAHPPKAVFIGKDP